MIEFQYFSSCPHAGGTLKNLKEVMTEMGISGHDLQIIIVPDPETARTLRFQGSPSIIVNGIDIYSGTKPEGFSYSCRVYEFNGRQTGIVPKEFIKNKLQDYK